MATRLTVIQDAKGKVIATAFPAETESSGDSPQFRMTPSSSRHKVSEIEVPDSFRELSAVELHQRAHDQLFAERQHSRRKSSLGKKSPAKR